MSSTDATSSEETTAAAPGFPPPLAKLSSDRPWLPTLQTGQRIHDYDILRLLGSGGFARVYLARQVSLDRLVALKVSPNAGSEARTLARLEHHHIVQVFSENVDREKNLRLLCMQFIPGATLARVMDALHQQAAETWRGATFLEILDQLCSENTALDVHGLEVRAFLAKCDFVELVCWLGARLAEALAHAHGQKIIHRDIKPANILINRYGRPFLADFNIAQCSGISGSLGGTLAYMAPEHLEAMIHSACPDVVDERSDLYSLGLVLFELLTGALPLATELRNSTESLQALAAERRKAAASVRNACPELPVLVDRLVRRCLAPEPERRFQSAAAFMHSLDGCRDLTQVEKLQARPGWILGMCRQRPFTMLILLALIPQVIGSAVNITYNGLLLVDKGPGQRACFDRLVLGYNAIIYPCVLLLGSVLVWRVYARWRGIDNLSTTESASARRQALALPFWAAVLASMGWFPGGLIFPVCLNFWAGPLSWPDSLHFFVSFTISGLIALTYSYLGVQYVVLSVLYLRLWSDPADARDIARKELNGTSKSLRAFQFLSVLIPLAGAALLIGVGPEQFTLVFRVLVTALIVMGLAGLAVADRVRSCLEHELVLLTSTRGES